ncbi:AMP-binding protein [Saccharopolyspora elongata]
MRILASATADPDTAPSALVTTRPNSLPQTAACIHHRFEHAAAKYPDKIAVIHNDHKITYRDLEAVGNCVAHRLIERGVRPGTTVGHMRRTRPGFHHRSARHRIVCPGVCDLAWRTSLLYELDELLLTGRPASNNSPIRASYLRRGLARSMVRRGRNSWRSSRLAVDGVARNTRRVTGEATDGQGRQRGHARCRNADRDAGHRRGRKRAALSSAFGKSPCRRSDETGNGQAGHRE